MSKHTKGKWTASKDKSEPVVYTKQTSIAFCYDIGGDEQIANALLIAAAPDLLEACKKGASIAEQFEELVLSKSEPMTDTFYKDVRFIQAAIAKAEGK